MNLIAIISICICIGLALLVIIDIVVYPQKMKIMNVVWPVTILYSGPLGIWAYYKFGRNANDNYMGGRHKARDKATMWKNVLKGTLHCGSGCTLGDLLSAAILSRMPVTILGNMLAGDWMIEYIAAFLIGIIFQYYAIKPMKKLSGYTVLLAAFKADAASLTFWQIGMYGWMAISNFFIFHHQLKANDPIFWLMMQIGMLCGLITAYPINWWLIKKGIKEAM